MIKSISANAYTLSISQAGIGIFWAFLPRETDHTMPWEPEPWIRITVTFLIFQFTTSITFK